MGKTKKKREQTISNKGNVLGRYFAGHNFFQERGSLYLFDQYLCLNFKQVIQKMFKRQEFADMLAIKILSKKILFFM